ncbi:MAG TPA: hypothetical protein VNG11_03455 [Chloroflexota bacterium]|nr:hypothetical protein [Chloroflexota bacterium]
MSSQSPTQPNLNRLRQAGVDTAKLTWFLGMAPETDLNKLPATALFLPGQTTIHAETTIDLATGRPIYLQTPVPPGKVYCLLDPIKAFMRTEASPK